MNLLNAAKTIWKDDLEGKRFTILARMRFMEALVLKDYLQKRQHMILILLILHPKRAQITLLGLMVKRMVLPYVLTNCSNNYGPFIFQKN
jgi:dTDP-glucose 4,6-dehydratase